MIFSEDDPPPRPKKLIIPPPLDMLGVEELGEYIAELQGEIARVEAAMAKKRAHKDAAAAFFKAPREE
jgi:uncharacterized small protein (DUF1192 family)